MKGKHLQSIYHANVNVNEKKVIFGILLHVVVRMESIQEVLWMIQRLCVMKLYSHTTKKQKLFQQILMKKKKICETQNCYILLAFLLSSIALLIAVSIYRYLKKYQAIKTVITISRHK